MNATGIDEGKLEAFMGQAVTDMGAVISAPLFLIGEKLGLYKAMAGAGPLSSEQVAERAGVAERSVREWLRNQAAGGYVTYDADSDTYTLPDEQALALADEDSPFYLLGAYDLIASLFADEEKITEAFRNGDGMGWHEHDHRLFSGTERFFKPGYRGHLVAEWIPALDGVQKKLEIGAKVADVGCGHGASTILMAEAFPHSEFIGFDYHDASLERAREAAEEAGVGDRVSFQVASAKDFPGEGYDLVTVFDCLHDMGDPVGASGAHPRGAQRRRHLDDRRAVRQRQRRGEPKPRGEGLLRRIYRDLYPSVTRSGGWAGARRTGRRGEPHRGDQTRRFQRGPPSHRDSVQLNFGGQTLRRRHPD